MKAVKSFYVPLGRITELLQREDADLLAYRPATSGVFSDMKVTRFQSRAALEAFCRKTPMRVLVRNTVPRGMAIHPYQTEQD